MFNTVVSSNILKLILVTEIQNGRYAKSVKHEKTRKRLYVLTEVK